MIVPDLKTAALMIGGKYGNGYLSRRWKGLEGWSAVLAATASTLAVFGDDADARGIGAAHHD